MTLYAELVTGSLTNRGNVVPSNQCTLPQDRRACYRSMFLHSWRLAEWVKERKSVAGFDGEHTAEAFVIDVDRENDLAGALVDARNLVARLVAYYDVPVSAVHPSFSGAKGFHIAIPIECITPDKSPRKNFSVAFRGLAHDIADGMESVDLKIYEPRRILRMQNTINEKTGLYKIPLTVEELNSLDIEEIKQLATGPRVIEYLPSSELGVVSSLNEIFEDRIKDRAEQEPRAAQSSFVSLLSGANSGGRNDALTKLTGLYISKGFDEEFTLAFMRTWNTANVPPLDADELERTVRGEFSRYSEKRKAPEIYNLKQMGERYAQYIESMKETRVKLGFPSVDAKIRGVAPGEALCILGKTSVGKSAFAQFAAKTYAQDSGAPVLFLSLEMPLESVFERDYQMEMDVTGFDVERAFQDATPEDIARRIDTIYTATPNLYTCETSTMTLDSIKEHVRFAEDAIYHTRTGLLLVDYLGLVVGKGKDVYEQISGIARGMKNLAKELHIPVMYLVQVNRKFSIYDELELGAARDSGAIDEAADYIIGVWSAPKEQQTDTRRTRLQVGIVKNRKGGKGTYEAWMDRRSLRFEISDPEPKSELSF